jgi:hypothetical protein
VIQVIEQNLKDNEMSRCNLLSPLSAFGALIIALATQPMATKGQLTACSSNADAKSAPPLRAGLDLDQCGLLPMRFD